MRYKENDQDVPYQRSDYGAAMVHRAVKTKRDTSLFDLHRVCNHRIAWRCSKSLANAIGHSNSKHLLPRLCESEQRPDDRRERITRNHQQLSLPEPIAEVTRKQFQQARRRFGESLD